MTVDLLSEIYGDQKEVRGIFQVLEDKCQPQILCENKYQGWRGNKDIPRQNKTKTKLSSVNIHLRFHFKSEKGKAF